MKFGFAKKIIDISLPTKLAGFARERTAHQVHDNIMIKIVIYENTDDDVYGLISYDLLAIDDFFMTRLKEAMDTLHLKIEHFIVSATHTHSGPGGMINYQHGLLKGAQAIFQPYDEVWVDQLIKDTMTSLQNALNDRKEANIHYAFEPLTGIGSNRNNPCLNGNDDLLVYYIEQIAGKKVVLVNFACHPTIMNASNHKISADFPGVLQKEMEINQYEFSLFLNGSCGDISTRFTRTKEPLKEVQLVGEKLAMQIEWMKRNAKKIPNLQIKTKQCTITLSLKKPMDIDAAKTLLDEWIEKVQQAKTEGVAGSALRTIESKQEGALINFMQAQNAVRDTQYDIAISMFKVNQDVFICIPGELFSQLSNSIQNEQIHFITYANGYYGYFANEDAYEKQYYEALSSPFEKGQSEYLMNILKEEIALWV